MYESINVIGKSYAIEIGTYKPQRTSPCVVGVPGALIGVVVLGQKDYFVAASEYLYVLLYTGASRNS